MVKNFIIWSIAFVFYSCDQKQNTAQHASNGIDDNKTRNILLSDSTTCKVRFYDNGMVYDSSLFKYGKKNGYTYAYSKSGKLKYQMHFWNGEQDGWTTIWNDDGYLYQQAFFYKGKQYGNHIEYFLDNRNQPKVYNCYDFSGNNRRVKAYDTFGVVKENEGLVIGQMEGFSPNFTYKVGKQVYFGFTVCNAPNEDIKIAFIDDSKLTYQSFEQNYVAFKRTYNKPGSHILYVIGEARDTLTNTVLKDTQKIKFCIKE